MNDQNITSSIEEFTSSLQFEVDAYFAANCSKLMTPPTVKWSKGRKYARVFQEEAYQSGVAARSVVAFVDMTNGDIMRPDGWKKPSLRSRGRKGNVYNQSSYAGHINAYGIGYL